MAVLRLFLTAHQLKKRYVKEYGGGAAALAFGQNGKLSQNCQRRAAANG